MLVVGKPPYGEPVVACFRIAFAVNIEHVAGLRIDHCLIGPAKRCIDRAEFGQRVRAVGIGDDDAFGAAVQLPRSTTVGGTVEHVINIL